MDWLLTFTDTRIITGAGYPSQYPLRHLSNPRDRITVWQILHATDRLLMHVSLSGHACMPQSLDLVHEVPDNGIRNSENHDGYVSFALQRTNIQPLSLL